ncbi:MAG: hypothetical protein EOO20_28625 [Chryseobacterium sp.]|nr:MAG: hypothetical protein EOO20_28625 [Chryseobacterium sp.]
MPFNLENGHYVFQLDEHAYYKFGIFYNNINAKIQVKIDLFAPYGVTKFQRFNKSTVKASSVQGINVLICKELLMDAEQLGEKMFVCLETHFRSAITDFRTALKVHTISSGSDDIYDVIRKSTVSDLINEITLYSVFEGQGRHIPYLNRLEQIIPRMNQSIYKTVACPIQLAGDFFITPLDGRRNELYTQQAFRADFSTLLAKGSHYSGDLQDMPVKMSTEAYFNRCDVNVQPLYKSGDEKLLLSAIYPSVYEGRIKGGLSALLPQFADMMMYIDKDNRKGFEKLNEFASRSDKTYDTVTAWGRFWGSFGGSFSGAVADSLG